MSKAVQKLEGMPVSNVYQAAEVVKSDNENGMIASESQRAMIEVMTQFEVAKRFPRDVRTASEKILNECARPTLAALGKYSYPMGGTTVEGPTIRLMEAIARAWGNVRFGWKVIDATKSRSLIRAFAFDLESNVDRSTEFEVRHWIDTKGGGRPCRDEREQNMLVASQAMRRVRACLEALIPRDVIDMAEEKCEETNKNNIDTTESGIAKLVNAFKPFQINKAMLEARFGGMKAENFKTPQILALRKIHSSLKDGMASNSDYFDLALATNKKDAKDVDPDTGEVLQGGDTQPDLKKEVAKAKKTEAPAAKPKSCETCVGTGIVHDAEGKGPCPDCKGSGKAS